MAELMPNDGPTATHPPGGVPLSRETVLVRLIARLDRAQIPYCLVGDTGRFPMEIQSDADFVVPAEALPGIPALLGEFCRDERVRLVQVLQHEQTAWYYVLAWFDGRGELLFFQADFCTDFFHLGRKFLGADELLAQRRPAVDSAGRSRGFQTLAPAWEFLYYFLKKVDKQELEAVHGAHLSGQWRQDPKGTRALLSRFWSEPQTSLVSTAAEANDWRPIQFALTQLQRELRGNVAFSPGYTLLEWGRKLRRAARPTGLLVAFLGPDGSGKSSVIGRTLVALAPAFRRTRRVHLRPRFGLRPAPDNPPVTDPHARPPRSGPASLAKLLYWWFDFTAGYLFEIRPRLARSTFVVFDRYFHDLIVDPRRYRFAGPMSLARWLSRRIPQPDLILLLDAPVETLRRRKQEVPDAEISRQREAYRREIGSLPNARIIDADRPLEAVTREVNDTILAFLARRVASAMTNDEGVETLKR